jgi:hypothetical protein
MLHKRTLATRLAEFSTANPENVNFRILIASRPENSFQAAFYVGSTPHKTFVRVAGESENEVVTITKEINLVINEEIEKFEEIRKQSEIYDDVHNLLWQEIVKVDNHTYLWASLVFPELHENAYCEESDLLQIVVRDAYDDR